MTVFAWLKSIKISLGWCVLGAMLLGLSVGRVYRPQSVDTVMCIALFLMPYPPMLEVDLPSAKDVFTKPWLMIAALFFNFLVSPLLIFGLLHLFVGSSGLNLMLGIILYGTVPGGGMAPAFTEMLRGNVNLSVTISAVGSVLTVGIVPLWAKCHEVRSSAARFCGTCAGAIGENTKPRSLLLRTSIKAILLTS